MAETTYYAMTSDEYSKIADAIRTRTGKTGQILGSEFATAISEIDSNDPSYAWNSEEVVINTGAIPDYAFYNNTKIKKVTIGAGVTSIGANAFNGCTALAEVDLGQGNLTINSYAFNGCTALKKIVIPENVVKMYKFAFNNCTSLTEIEYNAISADGDDLSTAGDAIFSSGTPIAKITIGNKVKKIPRGMFGERTNARTGATVTEITIPDNVEILEERAFQNMPSLTSITIPDSVTSIGQYAFYGCTGLTSITIPDSVTSIGQYAFYGCTGLTSITIMGKPYFNNYCFQNTSKVEQLVMKDTTGVPTLYSTYCFSGSTLYNSSSTAKIYVPSNLLASYQTATNWSDATIKAKLTALQDKITIDGTEYASVYGQTWQEWCESENNTDGFVVSGNNILTADKTKFVELVNEKDTDGNITRKTPVLPTDLVIELEHITTAI